MRDYKQHLILSSTTLKEALQRLDQLAADAILFVVDGDMRLVGSLTDGDIRRGFLKGLTFDSSITDFIQAKPRFIQVYNYEIEKIIEYRSKNFKVLPVVDEDMRVIKVINFRINKSYLPVDAVVMAGGRGERLRPLTDSTPKPMLPVGNKPIIRHNLDRLIDFGIDTIWISVRYKGEQIENELGDGTQEGVKINYIHEEDPLGTIGAVGAIDDFAHPYVLITNSDLLTNLNYEDFFIDFLTKEAALSVVTIPYVVSIPYAVLETSNGHVLSFKEKPEYTYYSNGGIYLVKKESLKYIPKDQFFNATDLMESLIAANEKVISFPMYGYWLDIGKHEDYKKAQQDIQHIKF